MPKYYVDLIDWNDPDDPLARMVVTSNLEKEVKQYEMEDPIGDRPHTAVPGIVHRHRDRCLLMLTNVCAVHCRFCFRKNLLEDNRADFEKSIQYIRDHEELWEVILSGGDPFTFTDHFMELVLKKLKEIPHVKMIRFHTRTPVVYPARVDEKLTTVLENAGQYIVVLHINHVREITPDFCRAVADLQKSGAMLLSQTVLLKGVNDSVENLETLLRGLVEISIKPYYLHHLDPAAGTHHFRISVERGKDIYRQLRQRISGVCIPEYVIDAPGGYGKFPVDMFVKITEKTYQYETPNGQVVTYIDHAS
ncbi:KamA family radical SAM protein [Candidatus Microgenomates bacterium]|nr:KamA family radical SAM protein [Candidatus Microgenomates bacterium]